MSLNYNVHKIVNVVRNCNDMNVVLCWNLSW